jgi:hypothetical protein
MKDTVEKNGYTLRILTDDHPESPADWATLGQIAYCSSHYTLGTECVSQDRLQEIADGIKDGSLIGLPVYAYVHSGETISTRPFSCPWDSGQSGFVYCTKEQAQKEWGDDHEANALRVLRGEVETFDQYLRGDVYGYTITDKDGDVVDSCWGFYGRECADEEGMAALNHYATMQGELFPS